MCNVYATSEQELPLSSMVPPSDPTRSDEGAEVMGVFQRHPPIRSRSAHLDSSSKSTDSELDDEGDIEKVCSVPNDIEAATATLSMNEANLRSSETTANEASHDVQGMRKDVLWGFRPNSRSFKFAFAAGGIIVSYMVHGYFQEDLFSYRSPEDGSKFRYAWLMQLLESGSNTIIGITIRTIFGGETNVPLKSFFFVGTAQLFAKTFTNLSLAAGLSFPICTLAKSAKMVPVMIGQLAVGGSSFCWKDYAVAAAIVSGTVILSLGDSSSNRKHSGEHTSVSDTTFLGIACIFFALSMDGVTAGLQTELKMNMRNAGKSLKTNDFLLWVNFFMAASAFVIALAGGDWTYGWEFLSQNPHVLHMVMISCFCSVVGQTFIFFMIANFDPLACTTVTTSRKIMSVLWSIATKGHSVSGRGAFGIALAVLGLILETRNNIVSPKRT